MDQDDSAECAYRRYQCMAGILSDVPDAVEAQGHADRARYGSRYLPTKVEFDFLLQVRFMVEVCGLPFHVAWDYAAADFRDMAESPERKDVPPEVMAKNIFNDMDGNILLAYLMACFLRDTFTHDPVFYEKVVEIIEHEAWVPLDTGAENW